MKTIGIIPSGEVYLNDKIFTAVHRDDCLIVWRQFKEYLTERGYIVHTIDCFPDIREVDMFVFFCFNISWYERIRQIGEGGRTVYIAFEPPVVDVNHSKRGLELLSKYFAYILTWNDDVVNEGKHFFKFMPPYTFLIDKSCFLIDQDEFSKKKLLCNISGNKTSYETDELYSERRRVIDYYDERQDFGLYGIGWEKENYKSYKGVAKSKKEVYKKYKFALCLENMSNVKGGISEKILDCFCSGIIPIYFGASNCSKYIPDECYIHYDAFSSLDEMDKYISEMEFDEYKRYLDKIEQYLASEKPTVFAPEKLAQTLIEISEYGPVDVTGIIFLYRLKRLFARLKKLLKKYYHKNFRGKV